MTLQELHLALRLHISELLEECDETPKELADWINRHYSEPISRRTIEALINGERENIGVKKLFVIIGGIYQISEEALSAEVPGLLLEALSSTTERGDG